MMKMKDKLYKNNHRGVYYKAKAFFFIFALLSGAMAIAIIPTYIAIKENNKEATHAQVEEVEEDKQEDKSEEDVEPSLTYEQ